MPKISKLSWSETGRIKEKNNLDKRAACGLRNAVCGTLPNPQRDLLIYVVEVFMVHNSSGFLAPLGISLDL